MQAPMPCHDKIVIYEGLLVIAKAPFQPPKRLLYTWTSPDSQCQSQIDSVLFAARDGKALHSQQK